MEIVRISKYRINRSSYENQGQVKDIKNVSGKKKCFRSTCLKLEKKLEHTK